jgi:hypothetical protein
LKCEFYWKEASGLQSKKYRTEDYAEAEAGCVYLPELERHGAEI